MTAEAAFWNELFASDFTAPEIRAHFGYARDHLRVLLDRPTPPPEIKGNFWRLAERFTWCRWQLFKLSLEVEGVS